MILTTLLGAALFATTTATATPASAHRHPDDCKIPVYCKCIYLGGILVYRSPLCVIHAGGGGGGTR
jgi:hypothetical protein